MMVDKYYLKEFEKAKKRGAVKEHLDLMFALSQIDGAHIEVKKTIKDITDFVDLAPFKNVDKIAFSKAWHRGFHFCLKNKEGKGR